MFKVMRDNIEENLDTRYHKTVSEIILHFYWNHIHLKIQANYTLRTQQTFKRCLPGYCLTRSVRILCFSWISLLHCTFLRLLHVPRISSSLLSLDHCCFIYVYEIRSLFYDHTHQIIINHYIKYNTSITHRKLVLYLPF